ncbi:unnamed protein product [Amoebophrya sp. A120]|nr:unnamed protein product [Amoebophrya sp. A120]|eukprot:GSA120T00009999001.1
MQENQQNILAHAGPGEDLHGEATSVGHVAQPEQHQAPGVQQHLQPQPPQYYYAEDGTVHLVDEPEVVEPPRGRNGCGCPVWVIILIVVGSVLVVGGIIGVVVACVANSTNNNPNQPGPANPTPQPGPNPNPQPGTNPPSPPPGPTNPPSPPGPPAGNRSAPKQLSRIVSNDPDDAVDLPAVTTPKFGPKPAAKPANLTNSGSHGTTTQANRGSAARDTWLRWIAYDAHEKDPFKAGGSADTILNATANETLKHHFRENITQDRVHLAYKQVLSIVPFAVSIWRTTYYESTNGVTWYLDTIWDEKWTISKLRDQLTTGTAEAPPQYTRPKDLNTVWNSSVQSWSSSWNALQVNALKYRLKARFEDLLSVRVHHQDMDDLFQQYDLDTTGITDADSAAWVSTYYVLSEQKMRKLVMTMFWALVLARIRVGRRIMQTSNDTWNNPTSGTKTFNNPHSDANKMGMGHWGFDRTIFGTPKILYHYTIVTFHLAIRTSGTLRPSNDAANAILGPGVYFTNLQQGLFSLTEVQKETRVGEECVVALDADALREKQNFYLDRFWDVRRRQNAGARQARLAADWRSPEFADNLRAFDDYMKNTGTAIMPEVMTRGSPSGAQKETSLSDVLARRQKEVRWELKENLNDEGTYLFGATNHWRARKKAAYRNARGRRNGFDMPPGRESERDVVNPDLTENGGQINLRTLDEGYDFISVCGLNLPTAGNGVVFLNEWVAAKEGRATLRTPRPNPI